jgi:hypothetical protein
MREAMRAVERHCTELGIETPAAATAEMIALDARLNDSGAAALTPGDTCPDNNVFTPGGDLILIDFEGAEWRPIAWDVAYLTVPWPSCWCAWRMASKVTAAALEAYRQAIDLPYAHTPAFDEDVAAASAAWAFISAGWLLPKALPDDPALVKRGPRRRAMIQHRLRTAAGAEELPAMAALAGRLDRTLTERWGEAPLKYAPAFGSK